MFSLSSKRGVKETVYESDSEGESTALIATDNGSRYSL